jgi:hypothetical protein
MPMDHAVIPPDSAAAVLAGIRALAAAGQLRPGPDGCPGPQSGDSHPG